MLLGNFFYVKQKNKNHSIDVSNDSGGVQEESARKSNKRAKAQYFEGIVPLQKPEHSKALVLYHKYAALNPNYKYMFGFYYIRLQLFTKNWNGPREYERGGNNVNGLVCDYWFEFIK